MPEHEGLADRRRASALAIIRASGRSGSTSARRSTGRRATAASRSSSAWDRPSDGRDGRHRTREGGERAIVTSRRQALGAGGWLTELLGPAAGPAGAGGRRPDPARYGAGPPVHRRPDRPGRNRDRDFAIRVARIEGSIYGEAKLKGVAVSDPQGVFLTSPEIMVDWAPGAWLYNSLHIDRLESPLVRVERLPKLRKTGRKGPLLPEFDIHIGQLKIDRLELARGVSGAARTGSLLGEADIRAGRAMVGLQLGDARRRQAGGQARCRAGPRPVRRRRPRDRASRRPDSGALSDSAARST